MELRQLEYFVAVAEELHFGHAASRLGMTQPPLSQQIRQLEEELGVQLFSRTNRRVALTAAGNVFLREVRGIFLQLNEAQRLAERAQKGEVGRLVLGFVGSATYGALPHVIRMFQESYPSIELVLREMPTPLQLDALISKGIDVGVVRPPAIHPKLYVETIQRQRCVAVVPSRHALAQESGLRMKQLEGQKLIMVDGGIWPGLYDSVVNLCQANGFLPFVQLEVTEVQTAVGLVAAGIGISILPESTARMHALDVRYIPFTGTAPEVDMGIAWRKDDDSEVVVNFLEVIRREVRGLARNGE